MNFIGITGSFAAGKSFVLNYLLNDGYPTFSADDFIRDLYKDKEIQNKILEILPSLKTFDKKEIARIIYNNEKLRLKIQNFIHPYLIEGLDNFRKNNPSQNIIFAEIPLLFEAKFEKYFNYIITVYCSEETRLQRAQKRAYFNIELFSKLKKIQMSQSEKIEKSDFIINTDVEMLELKTQIINILEKIKCHHTARSY